jgi:hypothetical protein
LICGLHLFSSCMKAAAASDSWGRIRWLFFEITFLSV